MQVFLQTAVAHRVLLGTPTKGTVTDSWTNRRRNYSNPLLTSPTNLKSLKIRNHVSIHNSQLDEEINLTIVNKKLAKSLPRPSALSAVRKADWIVPCQHISVRLCLMPRQLVWALPKNN